MEAGGVQAALIRFAIRFRGVIIALSAALILYGIYALSGAQYDVFPEFAPPQVSIQTEAAGLSPEQVEILVTRPIESAINGMPGVQSLRSSSIQGLSVVTAIFGAGSDIYRNRQLVAERLAAVGSELPKGVAAPSITPLTSSASTVLIVGLTSKTRSLMEVRSAADWTVQRRILSVPGVAKVTVFGGETRSLQIQLHPERLVRFNLAIEDVARAASRATGVRGAGFVETDTQRIVLATQGQSLTPEELGRTVVVATENGRVTLADLADIRNAPKPAIGGASILGEPGVVMMVGQQYGSNTSDVASRVEAAVESIRPGLEAQGFELHADLFRPAAFIATATGSVEFALVLGGALVVVVLFLFLFDWRTSAIASIAIPLSLLTAVLGLQALGITLNAMTLGGLAIAIGEVVDDAVIGIENVVRRLRGQPASNGMSKARIVLDACLEVRGAVVYATFAVLLVFLPVLTLSGVAGRLFAPLGIAYILAVVASLAVALTVTPALSMALLSHRRMAERDPPLVRLSRGAYERLMRRLIDRPRLVIGATLLATIAGLSLVPFFGATFLPDLKEGHFVLHTATLPGTSVTESLRLGKLVSNAVMKIDGVRLISQHLGRAEASDDTTGTNASEFEIDLMPGLDGAAQARVERDIRAALAEFPGVQVAMRTFLTERVEETLSGYTAPVVVNLYGNDLDALDDVTKDVAAALGQVPGADEVQLQSPAGTPQLDIQIRQNQAARLGVDPVDALEAVRSAYQGETVGQTYDGNQVFDVIVMLDPASRGRVEQVRDLPLKTLDGRFVTLGDVAEIKLGIGRYQVLHQGAQRVQTVTASVAGRDLSSFVRDAKQAVAAKIKLPPGLYIEFTGAAEAQAKSRRDLALSSGVAGLGIVLLLSMITGSWRNLVLVLVNLPFAMIGGVLAVYVTGGVLSLGSMVGFVTLFGITLRNSIMMISHYEHMVGRERRAWGLATAIEGAGDRLVPILMTSLVTALGLLPLALGINEPGREIEGPMAVVILGGLFTSMALNLLVLPILALRHARFETKADEFR
jgi:CzcA family heavy metal efflux pump